MKKVSPIRRTFQFHKGTIWTATAVWQQGEEDAFQFHKGTIWTLNFANAKNAYANFNSIKVQFEPGIDSLATNNYINFNSIKVQFELNTYEKHWPFVTLFQFHKGTIWTIYIPSRCLIKNISIP